MARVKRTNYEMPINVILFILLAFTPILEEGEHTGNTNKRRI